MSDLISRQAAIDVLADMYHAAERWGEEAADAGKPVYEIDDLRTLIKNLKDEWRTMKHD